LPIFLTILSLRVVFVLGPLMFLYAAYRIFATAETLFNYGIALMLVGLAVLAFSLEQ
jgi:hypothetical protein